MFDYLAAGKIIMSSKLNGICEVLSHKKNAIIVKDYDYVLTETELKNLQKIYDIEEIQKNALYTACKYTWVNGHLNFE